MRKRQVKKVLALDLPRRLSTTRRAERIDNKPKQTMKYRLWVALVVVTAAIVIAAVLAFGMVASLNLVQGGAA